MLVLVDPRVSQPVENTRQGALMGLFWKLSQVDIYEHEVEREAGPVQVVLALDGPAVLDIVGGGPGGVVDRDDDREKPCEDCQDLVGHDGRRRVGLPLRERVCYMVVRSGRVTLR